MQFTNTAIRNKMARLLAEKRADLAEDLRHEIEWSANAFH